MFFIVLIASFQNRREKRGLVNQQFSKCGLAFHAIMILQRGQKFTNIFFLILDIIYFFALTH